MNRPASSPDIETQPSTTGAVVRDYNEFAAQGKTVPHLTAAGFLRRVPGRRWNLEELITFGSKVHRTAEAVPLTYQTAFDEDLGPVRVYPLRLLEGVYRVLSVQFHWPELPTGDAHLEDRTQADVLRATRRAKRHLEAAAEYVDEPRIAEKIEEVLEWLAQQSGEAENQTASNVMPAPLRAL